MKFSGILIGSDNPDRLVEYYTKVLGAPVFSDGGYSGWQIGDGWVTIGAHSEVHGQNAAPGRVIWNIETSDIAADFERIKAAGGIVIAEPYGFEEAEGNAAIATFADPDDNYFQLMTPIEM
jgi:predicted enzyme related to lactoylglutathione lyase